MTPAKLIAPFVLATVAVIAGGLLATQTPACTPAQMNVARPLVRSGGLVCLAVPGEDREVCARAAELAQAVFVALDEQHAFASPSVNPSADAPPIPSAPPAEAGPLASALPVPAESSSPP